MSDQLGTCDAMTGNNPHTQEPGCINWRPEDQPRPTPPDLFTPEIIAKLAKREAEMKKAEAQGEAPQVCNSRFVDSHFDGSEHICQRQKGHDGACEDAEMLWKTDQTGAHPSQDARTQIDKEETIIALTESHANWVKRCGRVEAKLVKLWDAAQEFYASDSAWKQSTRDKLRDTLGQILKETEPSDEMLTRVEAGARSTPSLPAQDRAQKQEAIATYLCQQIVPGLFDWRTLPFPEMATEIIRMFEDWQGGSTPSPDPQIARLQEGLAWMAECVIRERGGTPDPDGWIRRAFECADIRMAERDRIKAAVEYAAEQLDYLGESASAQQAREVLAPSPDPPQNEESTTS